MGHLAFAAAIEAIISNLMFRGSSIVELPAEEAKTTPLSIWTTMGVSVSHFFRLPAFLRPCRD